MTQVVTMNDIAVDVKSLLEALSEREIRFNAQLMTRTAKLLRLISNVDLEESEFCEVKNDEE